MARLAFFVGFCCLVGVVGCSNSDPALKVDRFSAERQRLAGTWKVDFQVNDELVDQLLDGDAERTQSGGEQSVPGLTKQLLDQKLDVWREKLEQAAGKSIQLQFSADGTWSSRTALPVARGQKSGTWEILDAHADVLNISCTWKDNKSEQSETTATKVTFLGPGKIRLVPPNMAGTELELTFVRDSAN
jgi:hypothetical protein